MAYVFTDLPADSSELETFKGYYVSRSVKSAHGGRVPRPWDPPTEFVLEGTRRPWFEPALMRAQSLPALARVARSRAWCMRGFVTWRQAASLVSVPSLCFIAIWLLGHVWP
jgi:hypothetical protein